MLTNEHTHQRMARTLLSTTMALGLLAGVATVATAQVPPIPGCVAWIDDARVVYCGPTPTGSELFERGDDGARRQLTFLGGRINSVDVAADGRLVTFEAAVGTSPQPQVFVVNRAGPRAHKVAVGSSIVDLQLQDVIVGWSVVEVPEASTVRLTHDGANLNPSFTSGGERIGFVSDRSGTPELWSMAIDGTDQRRLDLAIAD